MSKDEFVNKRLLMEKLHEVTERPCTVFQTSKSALLGVSYIFLHIDEFPAADVVPVVRCKDCVNWNTAVVNHSNYCRCDMYKDWQDEGDRVHMPPDGFCSYGERKGGGE